MSTLKAARADNFYYPPDDASWSEQRKRMRKTQKKARNYFKTSALKYADAAPGGVAPDGEGGLGELAPFFGGASRGAVIRFEMPFKVICLKCEAFIAKGVRFDAERKAVGKYFSTTIYAFLMSCQFCSNPIVIQTDPEHTDYLCKVGVRKKVETFDTADAQTVELGHDHATKQQLLSNPLFKLECLALGDEAGGATGPSSGAAGRAAAAAQLSHESGPRESNEGRLRRGEVSRNDAPPGGAKDGAAAATIIDDKIDELLRINEINSGDWYLSNSALRKKFRNEKKNMKTISNFDLELVDENDKDVQEAKRVTFLSQSKQIKSHFKRILKKDSDIFSRTCASRSSGSSTIEDKRKKLQFIKHIDARLRRHARR